MTALGTIQKAIEKLEQLQEESTQGEWYETSHNFHTFLEAIPIFSVYDSRDKTIASWIPKRGDAELIVALHRTIPALLLLLREAADNIELEAERYPAWGYDLEIGIARAILGVNRMSDSISITELIAQTIYEHDSDPSEPMDAKCNCGEDYGHDLALHQAQEVVKLLDQVKAEAWAEGYSHCFDMERKGIDNVSLNDNPYLKGETE